jgi:hypothetical protein
MFPGLPTSLSGGYVIGAVDEECQARVVTRLGEPFGAWIDDTTPDLGHWLQLTVAKYRPLNQTVMVCVPPGEPHKRYPAPIVSVYEAYFWGMGCPFDDWLPLPKFDAYCVQKAWPGTHGKTAPTGDEFQRLLNLARANHPRFLFAF